MSSNSFPNNSKQPSVALFTDLDNTLLHPETRTETWQVAGFVQSRQWLFAVVTGRTPSSVVDLVNEQQLPAPEIIVGELGAVIWKREAGKYVLDENYHLWVKEFYVLQSELLDGFDSLSAEFKERYQFTFQDEYSARARKDQMVTKLGLFGVFHSLEEQQAALMELQNHFPDKKIFFSKHIPGSFESLAPGKYCIDIATVTKQTAVDYLCENYGIEHGVAAGDSGNDSSMLFESLACWGIIVGQAEGQIIAKITAEGVNLGNNLWQLDGRYFYVASNTEPGARGLYEGVQVLARQINNLTPVQVKN